MNTLRPVIETFLVLLCVILAVSALARWLKLPYPIALVLAGLLGFQPGFRAFQLTPDLILLVFLPILLFEGAYNVSARQLRTILVPVSLFAIPGIFLGTLATGALIHFLLRLSWPVALLFGALIAPTDPIGVMAIFREVGAPKRLSLLLEGESLFNDGVSITLFQILLIVIVSGQLNVGQGLLQVCISVVGALIIGGVLGWGGSKLVHTIDDAQLQTIASVCAAYAAYLISDHVGGSGAIAVVVTGLFFGNYGAVGGIRPASLRAITGMWDFLAFLGNALIFLLIGIELNPATLLRNAGVIAIAFGAALIGRAAAIAGFLPFVTHRYHIKSAFQPILIWGGIRGAVSLALVLSIPTVIANGQPFPDRDLLQVIAFGVVGVSLVGQGLTMRPLMRRLGLISERPERDNDAMRARLQAIDGAMTLLDQEHSEGILGDLHYQRLYLAYRLEYDQLTRRIHDASTAFVSEETDESG